MEVRAVVFTWLCRIKVVEDEKDKEEAQKRNSGYLVLLGPRLSEWVMNGKIVKDIAAVYEKRLHESIDLNNIKLVDSTTRRARIGNWKQLFQLIEALGGVVVSHESKELIYKGSRETLSNLMFVLYQKLHRVLPENGTKPVITMAKPRKTLDAGNMSIEINDAREEQDDHVDSVPKKDEDDPPATMALDSLNLTLQLSFVEDHGLAWTSGSSNAGELLVRATMEAFKVSSTQAGYLLGSGFSSEFAIMLQQVEMEENVARWCSILYENTRRLSQILLLPVAREHVVSNVHRILSILHPILLSSSARVVRIGGGVYSRLVFDFINGGLGTELWHWFMHDGVGMDAMIIARSQHGREILFSLFPMFDMICRPNYDSCFGSHLHSVLAKNACGGLELCYDLLPLIAAGPASRQGFVNSGGLNKLFDVISLVPYNMDRNILVWSWQVQYSVIAYFGDFSPEHYKQVLVQVLRKHGIRSDDLELQVLAANLMMALAEIDADIAEEAFKTIVFAFLSSMRKIEEDSRDLYRSVLKHWINTKEDAEVGTLLIPFLNQLCHVELASNLDFELLVDITRHPKLGGKGAASLVDFITGVGCLYDALFAGLSIKILVCVLRRFHHDIAVLAVLDKWIRNDLSKKLHEDHVMARLVSRSLQQAELPGIDSRIKSFLRAVTETDQVSASRGKTEVGSGMDDGNQTKPGQETKAEEETKQDENANHETEQVVKTKPVRSPTRRLPKRKKLTPMKTLSATKHEVKERQRNIHTMNNILWPWRVPFRRIYAQFARSAPRTSKGTFQEISKGRMGMSVGEFCAFCRTMQLTPHQVCMTDVLTIFRRVGGASTITFPQFLLCLEVLLHNPGLDVLCNFSTDHETRALCFVAFIYRSITQVASTKLKDLASSLEEHDESFLRTRIDDAKERHQLVLDGLVHRSHPPPLAPIQVRLCNEILADLLGIQWTHPLPYTAPQLWLASRQTGAPQKQQAIREALDILDHILFTSTEEHLLLPIIELGE